MTSKQRLPQLEARRPSHLRDFMQSYPSMRTVSDAHWRTWEDRCKINRAVRRKYDLPDDFDIDPEFFAHPILASYARYHHRQIQDGQHAGKRRANRHKRRAEDYRPSRSSLALPNLAEDVPTDEADGEKPRLAEEAAELRRLTDVVATEVGYLYFVGEDDLLERWSDDVEQSDLSLIYRKVEPGMDMGQLDEDHVKTKEAESEEL
ncbi:hypothetical protein BU25DRAFT_467143 [Macroventuria anomochaeta]|uniref:Uncharacterized protein n=1 Tax=Macroventuria anomochaeta TaxID=301207 RepID=A0ACB6S4N8_9PLEO|nr:uncharacterized protein BU25DRAFT_467143 [Macroventuria anomochaeta]KAF2628482.1 hypothetical protein BU25DRAFT_467143 [Macroventuria anomochaeta]